MDRHVQFSNKAIYPNQAGNFVVKDRLYKEAERIDKTLKDIIALISDEANNYYNILIAPRCVATISTQKNSADAYAYIDGRVKELYSNNSNWEDENFRNAARLLIDEWGESNKSLFDENHFPKVYPIKDSVSMNLLQIGELVPKLSDDFIQCTSKSIPWRNIKGMRNLLAHDYGSMNIEIVWETAVGDIPALQDFCKPYAEQYQHACEEIDEEKQSFIQRI